LPEFLTLLSPDEARAAYLERVTALVETEFIPTSDALGRVIAKTYTAPHSLPTFTRSTMDGYALCAKDTYGASETSPMYFTVVGEVAMGAASTFRLKSGECALIHTGGMLPEGADCAVMLEHTQSTSSGEIEVYRALAPGENLIKEGEDIQEGMAVLCAGRLLRPSEIGGLMALGITTVEVYKRPRVAILSSGDEVVSPFIPLNPGKVRDVNAYSLATLVQRAGGEAILYGIAQDDEEELFRKAQAGFSDCDMLIITAGSSASIRDLTAGVIKKLGEPGVIVHGVNVRPGKPTILALCNNKPVIGLPGNPVSALVIATLFVVPVVEHLGGMIAPNLRPTLTARLTVNLSSQAGREDWVPVHLVASSGTYKAEPIFGKSNLIFTLVKADGLIRIEPDANGVTAGTQVEVYLL
jgi:molybdopterin molybdotransferase